MSKQSVPGKVKPRTCRNSSCTNDLESCIHFKKYLCKGKKQYNSYPRIVNSEIKLLLHYILWGL